MTSSRPKISAIVAMSENRVIGNQNQLPWHLPADLKHFKTITTGKPILMGRKTYESIGRPLPNRINIIITRDKQFKADQCIIVHSLDEALTVAKANNLDEIFIIGGAQVFEEALPFLERIYLTIVHADLQGDAFFPELDTQKWREVTREKHSKDEKNAYDFSFLVLERK